MTIAERLKRIRGKESRESFAPQIGIHPQTLYRYEQGSRDIDSGVITSICKKFNISPTWLLFGEGSMHTDDAPLCLIGQGEMPEATGTSTQAHLGSATFEKKLEQMEEERRELNSENRRLWKENGDLRERCARLEERQACSHYGMSAVKVKEG